MFATFDPGNALAFAAVMFLMVLLVGIPGLLWEWRNGQAYIAYWRQKKLIELHAYAHELRQLAAARRALDEAA